MPHQENKHMAEIKNISIAKTRTTPAIGTYVSDELAYISIAGESYPENALAWYADVFAWLKAVFSLDENIAFKMTINLTYCNTLSAKMLLDIVDMIERHYLNSTRSVMVTFRVQEDDESMIEMAHELFSEWDKDRYTIELYECL